VESGNGAVPPPLPTAVVPPPLPTAVAPEIPAVAPVTEAPVMETPAPAASLNLPVVDIPVAPAPRAGQRESFAEPVTEPVAEMPVPPAPPAPAAVEPAHAAGEEPPKLVLQRPVFRPFVVPPPPIFGFAPSPESATPVEAAPPSPPVLSSLNETKPAAAESGTATTLAPETHSSSIEAESAPTPEMIASVLEGAAPETILPFPLQPVPFADLAETLAHETTYAPDLAEVVRVDLPVQDTETVAKPITAEIEAKPAVETARAARTVVLEVAAPALEPVVVEQTIAPPEPPAPEQAVVPIEAVTVEEPPVPAEPVVAEREAAPAESTAAEEPATPLEHKTAAIVGAIGATALGAAAAEVVFRKRRKAKATEEPPELKPQPEEIVGQKDVPAPTEEAIAERIEPQAPVEEVVSKAEEPDHTEQQVSESTPAPFEVIPPLPPAEKQTTPAAATPVEPVSPPVPAPPAAVVPPVPVTPAAAVPPSPPPIPLFPLPKVPAEPAAQLEVLPPPSLPLRRFDQDAVQALFMTEETLDLPKISRLAASLPGVYACVIATRDQACTGGTLPEGFDLAALLGLAPRVGEAAGRMPIGQLKHFTLYGDAYSVSFFERNGLSLCAVHRPRSFVPGVREKLVALADELSR
jgi:hypothetical protein